MLNDERITIQSKILRGEILSEIIDVRTHSDRNSHCREMLFLLDELLRSIEVHVNDTGDNKNHCLDEIPF